MTINDFIRYFKNQFERNPDFSKAAFKFRDAGESSQYCNKLYFLYRAKFDTGTKTLKIQTSPNSGMSDKVIHFFSSLRDYVKKHGIDLNSEIQVDEQPVIGDPEYNSVLNLYIVNFGALTESVMDKPREELDPDVWAKEENGYVLTPEAEAKIYKISDWAVKTFGITDPAAHVVGSIASNSYSDDSDIDLHFSSETFKPADADAFNENMRRRFDEEFSGSGCAAIGAHPVEVFFQPNKFQDMMSVGCYDVFGHRWETGPQILPPDFDPIAEYYDDDIKRVEPLIGGIRQTILGVYETAQAYIRTEDKDFKAELGSRLESQIAGAWELYQDVRKSRKSVSAPTSKKDALEKRGSREWKVADSAFKLLDRFGYIMIMRQYAVLHELAEETGFDAEKTARGVVAVVNENFSKNSMVADSEKKHFSEAERRAAGAPAPFGGMTKEEAAAEIREWLDERVSDYMLEIKIKDIALHGSRTRGDFRDDSDLDVVVYYEGNQDHEHSVKEDHIYNMLNDDPPCVVNGITVDFNPIRDDETGSLSDYLRRDAEYDARKIDESRAAALASLALSLALSIPGFASARAVDGARKMYAADAAEIQKNRAEFQDRLKAVDLSGRFGDKTFCQACNILSLTLFGEGRQDIGNGGMERIIDTILNRSGRDGNADLDAVADVCVGKGANTRYYQYSFWNGNKGAYDMIMSGATVLPKSITNKVEKAAWDRCIKYAVDVYTGAYTAKNKKINSYYVTGMKNPPAWAAGMTDVVKAGHHTFGYVRSNDPAYTDMTTMRPRKLAALKKQARNSGFYTVKPGDSLWKISKKHKTTPQRLAKLNKIDVNSKIHPGQILKIS